MNKITEKTSGKFSARVYQQHDALYFIRFFESDIYLPDSEFAADSEEEARAIADFELARLTEADIDDAADADSETEELNIRLAQLFNWPDEAEECLRPYRVQVDAETEHARQDVLAEIARLRRLIGCTPDDDIL